MLTFYRIGNGKVHARLSDLGCCKAMLTHQNKGGHSWDATECSRADFLANPCQGCLRKLKALATELRGVTDAKTN